MNHFIIKIIDKHWEHVTEPPGQWMNITVLFRLLAVSKKSSHMHCCTKNHIVCHWIADFSEAVHQQKSVLMLAEGLCHVVSQNIVVA